MRNPRYKGINLNRIHRGKVKLRRFTSLYRAGLTNAGRRVRRAMRGNKRSRRPAE